MLLCVRSDDDPRWSRKRNEVPWSAVLPGSLFATCKKRQDTSERRFSSHGPYPSSRVETDDHASCVVASIPKVTRQAEAGIRRPAGRKKACEFVQTMGA